MDHLIQVDTSQIDVVGNALAVRKVQQSEGPRVKAMEVLTLRCWDSDEGFRAGLPPDNVGVAVDSYDVSMEEMKRILGQ